MGVTKSGNSWRARFSHNGKRVNVGSFRTKTEAEQALQDAKWYADTPYEDVDPTPPPAASGGESVLSNKPTKGIWQRVKGTFNEVRHSRRK